MKRIIAIAVTVLALTGLTWAQDTNTSSVASNRVATTGVIAQATGDIVGTMGTWIVQHGSAGVAYDIPLTKSLKNSGSGPAATVTTWIYDKAWVSQGVTNIDSKVGLMNSTVFGRNQTINQMGVEISEALNTEGIANATHKIPVLSAITKAAAKMDIELTASIGHNTADMANSKFYERDLDLGFGVKVIKMF